MEGCWSILLSLCTGTQSRSRHLQYIEGTLLLTFLLLLHGTYGNNNTCSVGLSTPGGEYYAAFFQTLNKLVNSVCLFACRCAACSVLI